MLVLRLNLSESVIPETKEKPQRDSTSWPNFSKCTLHTMACHTGVMTVLVQDIITQHTIPRPQH